MTKQLGKSRLTHTEPGETNPLFKIYKRGRNSHSLFLFSEGELWGMRHFKLANEGRVLVLFQNFMSEFFLLLSFLIRCFVFVYKRRILRPSEWKIIFGSSMEHQPSKKGFFFLCFKKIIHT